MKPQRIIKKEKNKLIFKTNEKRLSFIKIKHVNTDLFYENILNQLLLELKINKQKIYKEIKKEISKIDQSLVYKKRLHLWFLENLVLIEISKKKTQKSIIVDEGLIHRIYILFSLSKNKNKFLKKVFSFYKQVGKIYLIDVNLASLIQNISLRKQQNQGFLYKNKKEMKNELKNYNEYVNRIKNKVKFKKIITSRI